MLANLTRLFSYYLSFKDTFNCHSKKYRHIILKTMLLTTHKCCSVAGIVKAFKNLVLFASLKHNFYM